MDNLDLTKILKDKEGIKLYSPLCGECTFAGIDEDNLDYPIMIKYPPFNNILRFTISGQYINEKDAECLLFPSKENRDWSTFNPKWRAKKGEKFYFVITPLSKPAYVQSDIDNYEELIDSDNRINFDRCLSGNYFKTEVEAQFIANEINKLFNRE